MQRADSFEKTLETSLVAQMVKRLLPMQETRVQSLGWEDPLEKEMAAHSSLLAWKISCTEEPGRLQSMGSQRAEHDWVTSLSLCCWERLNVGGEGDDGRWDGWMASLTQWTWVWVNSRSWWWTGRPGMLQSMGLQTVGHNWATELEGHKYSLLEINNLAFIFNIKSSEFCVYGYQISPAMSDKKDNPLLHWIGLVHLSKINWP